jgi:hypothetical protein
VALLAAIYEHGLWLSWPVFGLGMFLVAKAIPGIRALPEQNQLCNVPFTASQDVAFRESGEVELWVEGPLLSTVLLGARFSLRDSSGRPVASHGGIFPVQSTSLTRGHMRARVFTLRHPGTYTLEVSGENVPATDDSRYRLVFMRPYLLQLTGRTLGIILGSLLMIAGLVNFLMRLFS